MRCMSIWRKKPAGAQGAGRLAGRLPQRARSGGAGVLRAARAGGGVSICGCSGWPKRSLTRCYQLSQQAAMPIGLYRDLAVGVVEGGAETWGDGELYCLKASVGAPPDILGPQGQNWDLRPMDPR